MASRIVKDINRSYKQRHVRKPGKGAGVYADQLPGMPRGIHSALAAKEHACRCGRCGVAA